MVLCPKNLLHICQLLSIIDYIAMGLLVVQMLKLGWSIVVCDQPDLIRPVPIHHQPSPIRGHIFASWMSLCLEVEDCPKHQNVKTNQHQAQLGCRQNWRKTLSTIVEKQKSKQKCSLQMTKSFLLTWKQDVTCHKKWKQTWIANCSHLVSKTTQWGKTIN